MHTIVTAIASLAFGSRRPRLRGHSGTLAQVSGLCHISGGRQNPAVSRRLYVELDFPVRYEYEVEQLDRINRSGGRRAYRFPDAVSLDPQQDVADGPILAVTPEAGDPWVGVFDGGGYGVPPAATARLIAWPDARSFCVVYAGSAVVVRADDPHKTYEIDTYPVTGTLVVPERGVVVFADFTNLTAYGADGLLWRSRRLALDDVRVEGIEGDALIVYGFFGSHDDRFVVDLATGQASGQPFQPPE
jgi:hypothetical protein